MFHVEEHVSNISKLRSCLTTFTPALLAALRGGGGPPTVCVDRMKELACIKPASTQRSQARWKISGKSGIDLLARFL